MKESSSSTISALALSTVLVLTQLSTKVNADPAPLIIETGDAPTSTKTVTVTTGAVIPDTTITVLSVGLGDSIDTTLSGAAATSYLLSQSASLSSKECNDLALHGVQCTSVTTMTTTAGMTGVSVSTQSETSANVGAAGVSLPLFGNLQIAGRGGFSLALVLQALGALTIAGGCGVLAFVL